MCCFWVRRLLLRYGADVNHAVPATDSGTVVQCANCGRTQGARRLTQAARPVPMSAPFETEVSVSWPTVPLSRRSGRFKARALQ